MSSSLDVIADLPLDCSVEVSRVADGFRPLEAATVTHRSLDGTREIGPMRREFVRCRPAAVIIPYDPVADRIVLIRQFRIGHALATKEAAAVELPAGLLDEGEAMEATAARELEEETGLRARAVSFCYSVLTSPGFCDEMGHIFLALVDSSQLGTSAGIDDEDEDIRPFAVPADELVAAVDEGRVLNAFLIGAAHWFARHGRARAALLAAEATIGSGTEA
ncbi:NUDIX domain-containing protein [Antarcticirhabdus aurantiaca]|uniref:NUDIX hydrolase n=1 Tax=Antarcticirhabdus aurantiaca TaxID=2606717 RepID=A0ACD4NTP1_9HYPH|nr:NUDIX hydrolase [Antarcticirhabdus aurantiaca]WAJ30138.1 NUDIX hydrolase [Jeongeuplla avenae]